MSFRSMAINSSYHDEKEQVRGSSISCPKKRSDLALSVLTKQGIGRAGLNTERNTARNNKTAHVSSDRMQLLSYNTKEKDDKNILSSFQLAANIYKSNSDEFKLKKLVKKSNKKSVLTLPNEPRALPQACTVSDMNDSEYFNSNGKHKTRKLKKRLPIQRNKRKQSPSRDYEYYDREAKYCSQMNVYLDCSSTDVVQNFQGDGRKKTRCDSENKNSDAPNNVWAVLRDINRFQFQPSPPMSDDSIVKSRKKKLGKKKVSRGVYERCRTEQIAYISSIELNMKTPRDCSPSGSSSVDRITVINNEDGFSKICERVQRTFKKKVQQTRSKNKGEKTRKPIKICNDTCSDKKTCKRLSRDKEIWSTNPSLESQTYVTKIRDATDAVGIKSRMTMKSDASIETLVQGKSESSMKLRESSNTRLQRGKRCYEIEIQTEQDLDHQEEFKSRIHIKNTDAAAGTETHPNIGKQNIKMPLRGPLLPPRVAWRNSQLRSNFTRETRFLNTNSQSTKTIFHPGKGMSKVEDSANPKHQFTRSDILRTISKIRFPVVILGKDELSGTFEVEEYDYPQFNGLDKHMWLFMRSWTENTSKSLQENQKERRKIAGKRDYTRKDCNPKTNAMSLNIPPYHSFHGQKPVSTDDRLTPNDNEHLSNKNTECKQKRVAKLKPILQFRDRMLKLLYKKTSKQNIVENGSLICIQEDVKSVKPVTVQVSNKFSKNNKTDTDIGDITIIKPSVSRLPVQIINSPPATPTKTPHRITQKYPETRRKWGKTKWASDFIENVIKKIKNGTYYNNEPVFIPPETELVQNETNNDKNDMNVQVYSQEVSMSMVPEITRTSTDLTPKITIQKKKEPPVMLPGFDNVSSQLEIKSMTRNQIAVRHCVTNVVLQFDVNVLSESDQQWNTYKCSTSCIPVSVTDSKTKVYKCKTRILNAVLPAELCSIIPKVMKQFIDKDKQAILLHDENSLNTFSRPVSKFMPQIQEMSILSLLPSTATPEIMAFPGLPTLKGSFSKIRKLSTSISKANENIYIIADLPYELQSVDVSLLVRPKIHYQDYFTTHPGHPIIINPTKQKPILSIPSSQNSTSMIENVCRDLVPFIRTDMMYSGYTKTEITPQTILNEFFRMINAGTTNYALDCLPSPLIKMHTDREKVFLDCRVTNNQKFGTSIYVNITTVKMDPLLKAIVVVGYSPTAEVNKSSDKRIEYIKHAEDKELKSKSRGKNAVIIKPRMKGSIRYVKLYKKCKSTSHISSERSSTSLSQVTNLDQFFQAMGSSKLLCSVVDGHCEKKVLSFVSTLKNWTTEITPRQALLVMLLSNKRDTSSLVRFRPLLLQGIAVNRITRVSELDMEIEVIERERLNKLSQFPGVPSLESTRNNDNLLEELYWIAKTTASDYQKRFDESSEKHLKTLLEKRKNLNPSYLRVMARYVGLGLLKHPQTID